jgi:hypothetical protein
LESRFSSSFFVGGWLLAAIPAVICGHIAWSKIRKSSGAIRGKGIATAGLILGYIGLALGTLGIPLLVGMIQSDRERLHRLATERKEMADGKIKIRVPGTWTKLPELNKQATLQVGDKSKEMYLIVITDAKADLGDFTLEKHHQLTRDRMLQKLKNASATEPVPLTIDGHPALQDQLSGTEKGTNVVFLHTTVTTAIIFNKSSPGHSSHAGKSRTNYCARLPERFTARNRRDSDRLRLDASRSRRQFRM